MIRETLRGKRSRSHVARWLSVLTVLALCVSASAALRAGPGAAEEADAVVGTWQGNIEGGPRAATIMIVRSGGALVGTFMGYDYDRPVAGKDGKAIEGPAPKVARRTGLLLIDPKFDGKTLAFRLQLPSRDGGTREAMGELTLSDADNAQMSLKMPGNRPPLVMKMMRE